MDHVGIHTTVSKAYYDGDKIRIGTYGEDMLAVCTDGAVMWFIPKNLFLFDESKIRNTEPFDANRLIPKGALEDAKLTNGLIIPGKTLMVVKSDNAEVFVDKKLLKHFGSKDLTYKVKDYKTPILIYENGSLVGLVCPYNYKNKKEN